MKKIGIAFLLLGILLKTYAQESKTYALVIGISTYQENPSLDYAHRDAEAFATFLQSPNGGQVPKENITLLLNEQATIAAINLGLDQLVAQANKKDTVYIYFSGHGDVDLNRANDPGFLLGYDTPKGHYLGNAIEIESFNNYIVNTLSVKKEATVIVITDACHSGKLAEKGFNNSTLAAEQLRNVRSKEIRLTSCGPGELSQEDERWGNGRGVFSYYLIKGLNGAAKATNNGLVSVQAIENYLKESLEKDEILQQKNKPQNPLFKGNPNFHLSKIVQKVLDTASGNNTPVLTMASPLKKSLSVSFFEALENFAIESIFDFEVMLQLQIKEATFYCIDKVLDELNTHNKSGSTILNRNKRKYNFNSFDSVMAGDLKNSLKANPYLAKQFRAKLAQVLSDKVQSAINAYLKGDAAELEKRKYYNVFQNSYAVFPKMLSVARKLLLQKDAKTTELENQLEFKEYYFSGVVERLQIPLTENIKPILQKALEFQLKAVAMEEDADYVQNELGVLYFTNKEYEKAKGYFIRANELNPEWAIPVSNLAAVYEVTQKPDSGLVYAEKAIALQPNYQGTYINQGLLYEQKNNLLAGEEVYQKSIQLNSRYYLPFERLGYIYLKTTSFAKADSFLFEAEERKKGYKFPTKPIVEGPQSNIDVSEINCDFIGKKVIPGPTDILSNIVLGLEWLIVNNYNGDYVKAEKYFRTALQINPTDHIAYHYLGKALFKQKRWQEAEMNFKKANRYFISDKDYDLYMERLLTIEKSPDAACILSKIKENYYPVTGDYFCLGDTYIYWGHYQDAEEVFHKAILANPISRNGYYKLWTLLIAQGKYVDAEPVFWNYYHATKSSNNIYAKSYLAFFYNKVVRKFPDNGYWVNKAGSFFYNELKGNLSYYDAERKLYTRKIEEDEFNASVNRAERNTISDPYLFIQKDNDTLPDFPPKHIHSINTGKILNPEDEIEGTRETILPGDYLSPYLNGFTFLEKAATLLQNDENALADIYYKMGQITEWQNRFLPAMQFYKKAVFFNPDNANHKMKFADNAIACFFYRDALEQLDSLALKAQIDITHRLIRADFLMLANRYKESETAIQKLANFKDSVINVNPLKLKLAFIQNAFTKAIDFARKDLNKDPDNTNLLYCIANLYAKQNKPKEAMEWLQNAIEKGFNYGFVLKYDPAWEALRNKEAWKNLVKKIIPKEYKKTL